jgi:CubicO group peptidase (beta-lactamase class C family)
VVRRVDGRLPGQFLREEVCGPLGLDFWFGLTDAQQERAVELTGFPDFLQMQRTRPGTPELYWRAVETPPGARDPDVLTGVLI